MYCCNIFRLNYYPRQILYYGASLRNLKYGSTAVKLKSSRRLDLELVGRRLHREQDFMYGSGKRNNGRTDYRLRVLLGHGLIAVPVPSRTILQDNLMRLLATLW
jgi:hypothetical protein